ncbi:apolipoprotein N-acyltransferase [Saccharopolyspora shandongensis]|uniref:apolipoprotein N-acyltransferase n=1 Tax=Saccharopolyspora shandongensis TaxID=418495 RepID=UPI00341DCF2F
MASGGALLYAASPPRALWWLAPLSFTLLALGIYGRRARCGFALGMLFGSAYLLPLLKWLYDFLGAEFGVWPWIGVVAVESLFFGLAGAGIARVSALPGSPVWMAALVVGSEALRSRVPFGGFPWGRIGFTQTGGAFLPLAAFGGAALVAFAVALVGFGLATLLLHLRWRSPAWRGLAVMTVLPVAAGAASIPLVSTGSTDRTINVAIVQGNAPDSGLGLMGKAAQMRADHIAEAERLVEDVRARRLPKPDLVILPESSNTFDSVREDAQLDRIAGELGVPLVVGGSASDETGVPSNRMIRWEPGVGPTDEYVKQQLVPFSEFIPLRMIAGAVTPFVENFPRDMEPGDRAGVFEMSAARLGLATCYEVAYDHVLGDAVRGGAQLLAVPTNNAWFGRTEMTYQQLAMSSLRAVEHGRAVVVAATTGVSALVLPDGSVTRTTRQFTAERLVVQAPIRSGTTLATRLGSAPEWVLVALGGAAVLFGSRRRP